MRGRDDETGEFFSPSRSQQRREALAVFDLGEKLVALPDSQLAKLPMPEALVDLVRETRRITSPGAHKRQLQFLAKNMRKEDDETLDAIRRALEHDKADARRETAELHRFEKMRDSLVQGGDAALARFIEDHPHADRQHLRQLSRRALEELHGNKPLHAYRELFRELKRIVAGPSAGEEPDESGESDERNDVVD